MQRPRSHPPRPPHPHTVTRVATRTRAREPHAKPNYGTPPRSQRGAGGGLLHCFPSGHWDPAHACRHGRGRPQTRPERVLSCVTSPGVKDQFARCGSNKGPPRKGTWSQRTVAHALHTQSHARELCAHHMHASTHPIHHMYTHYMHTTHTHLCAHTIHACVHVCTGTTYSHNCHTCTPCFLTRCTCTYI